MKNKHYIVGVLWFIASMLISALNDLLVKQLAGAPSMQIAALRFAIGALSILLLLPITGIQPFKTQRVFMHFSRGGILFIAMTIWCFSLKIVSLVHATLITFTIPLFVLVLAAKFLHEELSKSTLIATIVGFAGAVISFDITHQSFEPFAIFLLAAAFLFACLDIMNKKFVSEETNISMLFYSALVTALLGALPAYQVWQPLSSSQWLLITILGIGGNLILYCLLKAFEVLPASSVAPYRYLELVFSSALGFIAFAEIPSKAIILGAMLIVPTTVYATISRK